LFVRSNLAFEFDLVREPKDLCDRAYFDEGKRVEDQNSDAFGHESNIVAPTSAPHADFALRRSWQPARARRRTSTPKNGSGTR